VADVQAANKTKSKLKRLLVQLDQRKEGWMKIEAFASIIELHGICLRPEDKLKLKKLAEMKGDCIRYREALALIHLNQQVDEQGRPLRQGEGTWILRIQRQ
jgi:hypothetical protein